MDPTLAPIRSENRGDDHAEKVDTARRHRTTNCTSTRETDHHRTTPGTPAKPTAHTTAPLPTSDNVRSILVWSRPPAAPGPDGIPARAWLVAGRRAHAVLHRMLVFLTRGGVPRQSFNSRLLVSKDVAAVEGMAVRRIAKATHPLGLKKTDAKRMAVALCRQHQQGFLPGRTAVARHVWGARRRR